MATSILNAAKETLGIAEEDPAFDIELTIHINSVLADLNDFGVGPVAGHEITGPEDTWEDFLGSEKKLNTAKSYMYLRLRLIFDPPATGPATESFNKQAEQMAWRLQTRQEVAILEDPLNVTDDGVIDGIIDGESLSAIYQNAKV
jgi:hypothetical protein